MWLQYGLDANDSLVSIEFVQRGKTQLQCPYCRGGLTAKKGMVLQHHFAHTEETCRSAARSEDDLPTPPLYDKFDLCLSSKDLAKLTELWEKSN
ncbi:competence protein CoiA family protein [Leptolyngbya ohadii]|uniref:competence protein CoiA family protein n=1 Tax=Leptolyngbya ohadii TaxID=1962290 RepID=UPI000B59E1F4